MGSRFCYKLDKPVVGLNLYVMDCAVTKCSNTTIECIQQTIVYVLSQCAAKGIKPPSQLHVQLDNAGDNKNKWVFGYLSHLVHREIFVGALASFFIVSHTHRSTLRKYIW